MIGVVQIDVKMQYTACLETGDIVFNISVTIFLETGIEPPYPSIVVLCILQHAVTSYDVQQMKGHRM